MGKFLDTYPLVPYDIFGNRDGAYQIASNVFVRAKILDSVKARAVSYYDYDVQDGDTPEMLASKYYGDPELHWVILFMNDIVDPQYDWPLDYNKFVKYVQNKYGSIAAAKTRVQHYEKVIERYDSSSQVTTTSVIVLAGDIYQTTSTTSHSISTGSKTFTVDPGLAYSIGQETKITSTVNSANFLIGSVTSYSGTSLVVNVTSTGGSGGPGPYTSWAINLANADPNTPPITENNTFNLSNGTTVTETITRKIVYCWDYELSENEKKRSIKVLRKEYIGAIKNQFQQVMLSLPKVTDTVLTAKSSIVRLRK